MRCIHSHNVRHLADMADPEIKAFLTHLAVQEKVAASTQNQALSALLFLYRHVLGREIGDLGEVIRTRKPWPRPVLMTRNEVRAVLSNLTGSKRLMASQMYGAGLRPMECLRLRVQDIDFSRKKISIRDVKGAKHRITVLPEPLKAPPREHLKRVKTINERDLANGWGRVLLPGAPDRKCPNAPNEWRWQWVFPQEHRRRGPKTGEEGPHHGHKSIIHNAVNGSLRKARLAQRTTCNTFWHSSATQVLKSGYDIRAVRQLLGHNHVKTTMIYTHVLNRGGKDVRSPVADFRGGTKVSYIELIHLAAFIAEHRLSFCKPRGYDRIAGAPSCRDAAAQRCYEQTI